MDASRARCGVDCRICSAYHAQGGEPTQQQPEEVEEGVKVDVNKEGFIDLSFSFFYELNSNQWQEKYFTA